MVENDGNKIESKGLINESVILPIQESNNKGVGYTILMFAIIGLTVISLGLIITVFVFTVKGNPKEEDQNKIKDYQISPASVMNLCQKNINNINECVKKIEENIN